MYTSAHSRIVSTGVCLPDERVSSADLMEAIDSKTRFDVPHGWLERVTGIVERRRAAPDDLPSDLAARAAQEALERAELRPADVDMVIYAGVIRDHMLEPGTAHVVQHKIGAGRATVVDLNNACLGFMSAVHVMDAFVGTGQVRNGLVVTGELGSRFADRALEAMRETTDRARFDDLLAGLTLGDAGAAMVVGPKREPELGFAGFNMLSQGQHASLCYCGDVTSPGLLHTDMTGILSAAGALSAETFREMLEDRLGWQREELARFVAHQVGKGTFRLFVEKMRVAEEIMTQSVWHLGNVITATIPVNLHQLMYAERNVSEGDKVVLAGAGSGVSAGFAGIVWDQAA